MFVIMSIDFQACDDDSILSDQGCHQKAAPRPSHDAAVAAQAARTEVSPPRKKAKHCLGPGLSRRGQGHQGHCHRLRLARWFGSFGMFGMLGSRSPTNVSKQETHRRPYPV